MGDSENKGGNDYSRMYMVLSAMLMGMVIALVSIGLTRNWNTNASSSDSSEVVADAGPQTIDIELSDLKVTPASIDIAAGTDLTLNVHNSGAIVHNIRLDDKVGSTDLPAGGRELVHFGKIDKSTTAICSIPGHKEAGMVMAINVKGSKTKSSSSDSASTSAKGAKIDFNASPDSAWKPRDPALAAATDEKVHAITLHAQETVVEVSPGVKQQLWTFNGTAPGPTLRGRVGDVFDITLVNDGKVGHSIDFHSSFAPWNTQMRTIESGESLQYKFTAEKSGVFMYHCGTAPALHHIGNGMFGAIIIDPPNLAPVDREYAIVQSELYTGPANEPGDLTKMINNQWDAVVFNGYVNQYKFSPIRVELNQRVRVWVLDAGPSENSSFHIVGTIFDTVYKEGAYTLQPGPASGGAQALDLQPAQGGFVEFSLRDAGLYPIVTHKFSNVGKGALGLFQAGDIAAPAAGGH